MELSLPASSTQSAEAGDARPAVAHLRALLVILVLGAIVRVALWASFANIPIAVDDEKEYNAFAVNLVTHGEFGTTPGRPASIRPPLYPVFVAAIYSLCGVENYHAVRLAQAALSLLTVLLLYWLGREVLSPTAGLWLAGLYCFYPSMLGLNNLLYTEVLFTLLLVAACLTVVLFYRRGHVGWLALAGVLLGLAALTRSVVYLTPPLLAGFVLLFAKGPATAPSLSFGKRLVAALAMVLTFALTLAPWVIRNTALHQTLVIIDTMGGRNLMMGNYQYTPLYRAWDAVSLQGEQSWIHEVREAHPEIKAPDAVSQGHVDKLALKRGLKFIRENPGLTFQRDVIKFFDFWGLERELVARAATGGFGTLPSGSTAILAVVIFGSYAALLFLAVYGMILAPPEDRRVHWFLLAVVAFITAMHTLVFGHSRYHLPLMPFVLLYATSALLSSKAIWQRRKSLGFVAATVVCVGFVLGWGWNAVAGDWEKAVSAVRKFS